MSQLFWTSAILSVVALVFLVTLVVRIRASVRAGERPELISSETLASLIREVEEKARGRDGRRHSAVFARVLAARIDAELAEAALRIGYTPPKPTARPPLLSWKREVARAPGSFLYRVLSLIFSARDVSETLAPTVADLRYEYFEALATGHRKHARWIHVRGVGSLLFVALTLTVTNVIWPVLLVWRRLGG